MWACAKGHLEIAVTLYNWNKGPLHVFNSEGHLPLMVARRHGHHQLADHLEQIDKQNYDSLSAGTDILGTQQTSLNTVSSAGNLESVSSLRSTPDRMDFPSASPGMASTPISKDLTESNSVFKTPHQIPENGHSHELLHIQIPSTSDKAQAVPHPPHLHDNFMRRQSDQMLAIVSDEQSNTSKSSSRLKQKLKKRLSVDLPHYEDDPEPLPFSPTTAYQRPVREANSEPHLPAYAEQLTCELNPMLSGHCNNDLSPDGLMQLEGVDPHDNIPEKRDMKQREMPINMDTGKYCKKA